MILIDWEYAIAVWWVFFIPAAFAFSESLGGFLITASILAGMLFLLWKGITDRRESPKIADSDRPSLIKTIFSWAFITSFMITVFGFFLASFGYEPEIFNTGWRIWTAGGLMTITLLAIGAFGSFLL